MRMTLANDENTLGLHWKSGKPWLSIDTATWRITRPRLDSFPWRWTIGGAAGAAILTTLAAGLIMLIRRRGSQQAREAALPAL
jgi:hypothetical protein